MELGSRPSPPQTATGWTDQAVSGATRLGTLSITCSGRLDFTMES